MTGRQASQITKGMVLVVIGLLLLAGQIHIAWDWNDEFGRVDAGRLWPLILVTIGIGRFLAPREDGHWPGGVVLVFLGGVFLMHTLDVMSLRDAWPLFIVAGGLSVMLSGHRATGSTSGRKDGA
jgi:hypothetical protein